MKRNEKTFRILLVLMMIFSLSLKAFAAPPTIYTITVNNSQTGHTYEAYQIFAGDLSGKKLSNIVWGTGVTSAGQNALQTRYGVSSAAELAAKLTAENVAAFASDVSGYLAAPAGTSTDPSDGKYQIPGLSAGYYLVKDRDGSLTNADAAYTSYILEVVEDSTISPKSSTPTVEKKVKDINNSTETALSDWQDSADHDIGDTVPFLLKATLGGNLSGYSTYKLVFHDTLSTGLTYHPDSITVKINGTELDASHYTVTHDSGSLTVTIDNVLAHGAGTGSVVTVEYTATLNENAVIGAAGNPNTVYLEYSNNPNLSTETGKTPEDKVTVFTFQLSVDKVDENSSPLKGAGFTLYKWNAAAAEENKYEPVGPEVKGTDLTTFVWTGLDDGNYKLVETTVPAGYNKMADLEFTITADHELVSADPKLTALTANGESNLTTATATGILSGKIINQAGSTLPETGGVGTTIFYATGGILALAAAVLLITRRRMNSAR